jgi:hypothetical protein
MWMVLTQRNTQALELFAFVISRVHGTAFNN